ncbi:hypothetical protein ACFHW0_19150 [Micromonospora sp. LOL_025]|uniref:hypothetical protein n=1 Tax=Micromonospora sp. LOL_025 TaxID=3345413 RepID=UPI003A83B131
MAADAYGQRWEERGLRELARRAALLAALFPFPDGTGGATSLASTAFGEGSGRWTWRRSGRARAALVGGGLAAALLLGGAGLTYAADDEPLPAAGPAASEAPTEPTGTPSAPAVAPPTPTSGTTPAPTPPVAPAATTAAPEPAGTGTPTTPAPASPTAPTSTGAVPADTVAPSVGRVAADPTALDPRGCPYGPTSSTISAIVSDDRTAAGKLRVSFRYTLDGRTAEVAMAPGGRGSFRGVLGDLPRPATSTRIPVRVVAVDEAGNVSPEVSPVHVTLYPFCIPG